MGALKYCFEREKKKNDNNNNMVRLTNGLLIKGGNIITLANDENKNNSDSEISKTTTDENNINIKKLSKKRSKNLSVDTNHTKNKNDFDFKSEKKHKSKKKKFKKNEMIGEGRFGVIYYCTKISGGERYVVKIYNKINEKKKERIRRNLKSLYELDNENILKAKFFDDKDISGEFGDLSIIYETVDSGNVKDLIKDSDYNEELLENKIKEILDGLKYLHEKKIYHKNLKPSNFLVDNGTIKISDCLIDSIILGNATSIYNSLLKSEKINYYIPPFFIKEMNEYYEKKTNNSNISSNEKAFKNWISYDLWCLGCSIIEVVSGKNPWNGFNFQNNSEFIKFLGDKNPIPTIPNNLSPQCKELIMNLFNYSYTKEKNIYEKLFNLDIFKPKNPSTNSNYILNNINETMSGHQNDDSNSNFNFLSNSNNTQIGKILEKNNIKNILNGTDSYSVSNISEENNSLVQSYTKLNQSNLTAKKNFNIKINNNDIKTIDEASVQNEFSPDYVKVKKENNFEL